MRITTMNSFRSIRYFARAIGRTNALKILVARLANSELVSIKTPFGPLKIRPDSTDPLMANDILWQSEYDFHYPQTPRLIIDAGANIGCTTKYFLSRFDTAKVIAIEPDPANFAVLRANCQTADRVILLNKAIWPEKTQLKLDYSLNAECAVRTAISTCFHQDQGRQIDSCETTTPADLVHEYGDIDILKLDIEGAEAALFSPKYDLSWLKNVASIVIELHDRYEIGCSRNFWLAVNDFTHEEYKGENIYVSRQ